MMRPSYVITTLATLELVGCSDSTAPSTDITDSQVSADMAASTAPSVATSVAAFLGAETGSSASSPSAAPRASSLGVAPSAVTASACTTHSASGVLTFVPESHPDSVTFSWTWEFFAGAGCQNAFDASTTDSIAFTAAEREVDNDPRFVASATNAWQFDVVGAPTLAAAATHVWNGVGVGADTAVHETPGLDRTYIGAAYDTASDVTFPHPLNGVTVPASGTFSRWTTVTITQATGATCGVGRVNGFTLVGLHDGPDGAPHRRQ
jgi:hypothetical protein